MSSADDMIKVLKSNKELLDKNKPFKFDVTLGTKKIFFSKRKLRKLSKEEKNKIKEKVLKQNNKQIANFIVSIFLAIVIFGFIIWGVDFLIKYFSSLS